MKKYLLVLLVIGAVMITACGGSKAEVPATPVPVPADWAGKTSPIGPDAAVDGAKVFQVNCEPCHGPQGYGDGPSGAALDPKPRNLSKFVPSVGDDYLFWRINTGSPGTSMAPWQGILTEEQIWQVIAFVRTLK